MVEQQEIAQVQLDREKTKVSLGERALEEMTKRYPNAEVTFEKGYDFGTGRNRRRKVDTIKVVGTNGTVEFNFHTSKEDPCGIAFGISTRVINKEISAQVNELIING